jgi:phosphoglycerol transferase MdoB-like AlkP superfamily enzyme
MNFILDTSDLKKRIHFVLLIRLLLIMCLFMICRILFYAFNTPFFPGITPGHGLGLLAGGIKFDIVAVLYTNILYIFLMTVPFTFKYRRGFQKFLDYLFIITNSIALSGNCMDFIYYRFTIKRTTWSVLKEFSHQDNLGMLFAGFIVRYWYVAVIWILMVLLVVKITKDWQVGTRKKEYPLWMFFLIHAVLMGISVKLFIAGARGGFLHSTRPITLSNAGTYVQRPKEMFIVLNTPFCIFKTIKRKDYERVGYFRDEKEAGEIFNPIHVPEGQKPFKPMNVVILIWESFGKEMVGSYNQDLEQGTYKGYTPFIDSLMQHSRVNWYSFANGAKSIEAIPSVLTSIPGIKEPFVTMRYTDNQLPSLPSMLREKGYNTSFFHGAPNGSMGFQAFANLIGVEKYYGKSEYNNDDDYDGIWGIWDEEFMQFWAKKMNTFRQPFMSTLFTVSSHDPYKVPERYKGKFPAGPLPIYEAMGYSDYAVRKFFEKAKTMPWFSNTLFIITADHAATFAHYPEYQTSAGNFSIPILFYSPGDSTMAGRDSVTLVQQIDIMPSILSYLNYDKPYFAFGKNIFKKPPINFAVNYDGVYQWFNGPYLLQYDGQKTVGLYNYQQDKLLKDNLKDRLPAIQRPMELQVKAFAQQYINRMLDDRMTVKP